MCASSMSARWPRPCYRNRKLPALSYVLPHRVYLFLLVRCQIQGYLSTTARRLVGPFGAMPMLEARQGSYGLCVLHAQRHSGGITDGIAQACLLPGAVFSAEYSDIFLALYYLPPDMCRHHKLAFYHLPGTRLPHGGICFVFHFASSLFPVSGRLPDARQSL